MFAPPHETVVVGKRLLVFDTLDSTNAYALRHGSDGTVVVADHQTAGRGRHGRSWHSAPGLGLWFSVVLEGPTTDGLVFGAALAVRDALQPACSLSVKWPNDLVAQGKKVCGILVERRDARCAIGIGINVHHRPEDFPPPLRQTAASLEMVTGIAWRRADVLQAVLIQFDKQVMLLRSGRYETVRRAWADACDLLGREVRCGGGVAGAVTAIDGQGALLLATPRGPCRVMSGDVTVVRKGAASRH